MLCTPRQKATHGLRWSFTKVVAQCSPCTPERLRLASQRCCGVRCQRGRLTMTLEAGRQPRPQGHHLGIPLPEEQRTGSRMREPPHFGEQAQPLTGSPVLRDGPRGGTDRSRCLSRVVPLDYTGETSRMPASALVAEPANRMGAEGPPRRHSQQLAVLEQGSVPGGTKHRDRAHAARRAREHRPPFVDHHRVAVSGSLPRQKTQRILTKCVERESARYGGRNWAHDRDWLFERLLTEGLQRGQPGARVGIVRALCRCALSR